MYCSQCGANMEAESTFCGTCGVKNNQLESTQAGINVAQKDYTPKPKPASKKIMKIVLLSSAIGLI